MRVRDVMVDRSDIVWLDLSADSKDVLKIINSNPHTRYPVCYKTLDNMLGLVHVKDIIPTLQSNKKPNLKKKIEKPMFVSPSIGCMDLVVKFKNDKQHLAFVIDESGGIDGVVTIQDIVEEIVGQLDNQIETMDPLFFEYEEDKNKVTVDGRYELDKLEEQFGTIITKKKQEGDPDTVAGLVILTAGYLPARGEVIQHSSGLDFEIIDADARRVSKVCIHNLDKIHSKEISKIVHAEHS
jgi:CBS domain containing-hemolysin-like protein